MTTTATGRHRPRLDPDARGGLRLTLAAAGGLILVVPFAVLLLLVVDHWVPLRELDYDLAGRLNAFAFTHPGYVTSLKVVTTVGHPAVFDALTVAVAAWLWRARRQPRLAAWLAVTVFGGGLLSTIVKNVVGRRRPLLPHPVAHAASASFLSGHAAGSVVGVGSLLLVFLPYARRPARPAWIGLGVLIVVAIGSRASGSGCTTCPTSWAATSSASGGSPSAPPRLQPGGATWHNPPDLSRGAWSRRPTSRRLGTPGIRQAPRAKRADLRALGADKVSARPESLAPANPASEESA